MLAVKPVCMVLCIYCISYTHYILLSYPHLCLLYWGCSRCVYSTPVLLYCHCNYYSCHSRPMHSQMMLLLRVAVIRMWVSVSTRTSWTPHSGKSYPANSSQYHTMCMLLYYQYLCIIYTYLSLYSSVSCSRCPIGVDILLHMFGTYPHLHILYNYSPHKTGIRFHRYLIHSWHCIVNIDPCLYIACSYCLSIYGRCRSVGHSSTHPCITGWRMMCTPTRPSCITGTIYYYLNNIHPCISSTYSHRCTTRTCSCNSYTSYCHWSSSSGTSNCHPHMTHPQTSSSCGTGASTLRIAGIPIINAARLLFEFLNYSCICTRDLHLSHAPAYTQLPPTFPLTLICPESSINFLNQYITILIIFTIHPLYYNINYHIHIHIHIYMYIYKL